MCALQHDGRHVGQPAQFFGPLQGYQPTLSPPPSRTLRVPAQLWALALASDLRSSHAMHFLDHGRLLAADDPSASPYAANALLPMSDPQNAKTRWEHLERIRLHLGFVPCDAGQRDRLLHHLTILAQALPRSTALRHAADRWLQQEKIVRPGRTTLRDLITAAREAALQTVYTKLTSGLSSVQAEKIESLLVAVAPLS